MKKKKIQLFKKDSRMFTIYNKHLTSPNKNTKKKEKKRNK